MSSRRQAGERNVSLDVQRERFHAYCQARGYTVAAEYTDIVSGRKDDRREYQRLLDACRRHEVEVVVTMFLDRFGRNADEIMLQLITLSKLYGVEVACTDEDISNQLIRYVSAWKAGSESERIGERTRAAIVQKLQAGEHWARVPYGWRKHPETRRLEINEAEATVVREMARLCVEENLGCHAIMVRLNADGYRRRDSSPWTDTAVAKILRRPRNAGAVTWGGRTKLHNRDGTKASLTVLVPAILSEERHAAVLERMRIRDNLGGRAVRDSPFALAGLLRCGHCGYTLHGSKSKSPRAKSWALYYICRGNHLYGSEVCAFRYYNRDRLEAAVVDAILDAAEEEAARAAMPGDADIGSRDWRAELADLQRERERLDGEFLDNRRLYRNGTLSEEQLARYNAETQAALTATEARLVATERDAAAAEREQLKRCDLPARARSLVDAYTLATIPERKALLQDLLERVTVWGDGLIRLSFRM